jgi:GMP synthase (glutamine-hydrolysing)
VRLLSVVHQRDAASGVFGRTALEQGHELGDWMPAEAEPPRLDRYQALLVFGGAMDADQEDRHPWLSPEKELLRQALDSGLPVLGVCLGSQLLAAAAGAPPRRAAHPEIGWHEVELTEEGRRDPLLGPLPDRFDALQWHSYEFMLPPDAAPLARSSLCLQAYKLPGPAWGLQFHAEAVRESLEGWIDRHREDEDAARVGLDPDALRTETAARMSAWNELGAGICSRFLAEVEGSL